jgi:hypothetical protein
MADAYIGIKFQVNAANKVTRPFRKHRRRPDTDLSLQIRKAIGHGESNRSAAPAIGNLLPLLAHEIRCHPENGSETFFGSYGAIGCALVALVSNCGLPC